MITHLVALLRDSARRLAPPGLLASALVAASLAALASPAQAQSAPSPAREKQLQDAGSGVGVFYVTQWSPLGFGVDFSQKLTTIWTKRTLNAVGELTVTKHPTHNDVDVVGGIRYVRHTKVRPALFAQVLAGLNHENREDGGRNDFRLQPGGGADIPIADGFLLRLQNDYPFVFAGNRTIIYLRFSVGVEIHLK